MSTLSLDDILSPLYGKTFRTSKELEEAIAEQFNTHRDAFSPRSTYRHLIDWANQQGLIRKKNGMWGLF